MKRACLVMSVLTRKKDEQGFLTNGAGFLVSKVVQRNNRQPMQYLSAKLNDKDDRVDRGRSSLGESRRRQDRDARYSGLV